LPLGGSFFPTHLCTNRCLTVRCPFSSTVFVSRNLAGGIFFSLNKGALSCSRLAVGTYFVVLDCARLREYGATRKRESGAYSRGTNSLSGAAESVGDVGKGGAPQNPRGSGGALSVPLKAHFPVMRPRCGTAALLCRGATNGKCRGDATGEAPAAAVAGSGVPKAGVTVSRVIAVAAAAVFLAAVGATAVPDAVFFTSHYSVGVHP